LETASKVMIAEFRADHAGELIPMWRESFELGVGVADPHPMAEQERYFRAVVVPNNDIRVAFLEGKMVGFVAASPTSISQLYVRKGFHRRGIGTRLLDWAKERSRGSLWLFTFERNHGARAFYERHGFRIVARGFEPMWRLNDLKYEWRSGEDAP
jgi:ribosomal protein S18 acetylase RimI-like enzyme